MQNYSWKISFQNLFLKQKIKIKKAKETKILGTVIPCKQMHALEIKILRINFIFLIKFFIEFNVSCKKLKIDLFWGALIFKILCFNAIRSYLRYSLTSMLSTLILSNFNFVSNFLFTVRKGLQSHYKVIWICQPFFCQYLLLSS